jgi:hypothetical protein
MAATKHLQVNIQLKHHKIRGNRDAGLVFLINSMQLGASIGKRECIVFKELKHKL